MTGTSHLTPTSSLNPNTPSTSFHVREVDLRPLWSKVVENKVVCDQLEQSPASCCCTKMLRVLSAVGSVEGRGREGRSKQHRSRSRGTRATTYRIHQSPRFSGNHRPAQTMGGTDGRGAIKPTCAGSGHADKGLLTASILFGLQPILWLLLLRSWSLVRVRKGELFISGLGECREG